MQTKLHRLYKRKLTAAINVVDEPENKSSPQPDGHDELSTPNQYPEGEQPDNQSGSPEQSFGFTRRIEGVSKNSGMIAIYPTDYAAKEIRNHFKRLPNVENARDLHITLVYLGKELTDEQWDTAKQICDHVADAHEVLRCRVQGLGVFDHDDGGRPFYCNVDAVGMADLRTDLLNTLEARDIQVPADYDFTPHMTIAYLADPDVINLEKGSPGVRWDCNEIYLVKGDEVIHTSSLGGHTKEAGGFGLSLHEINTPSKGQGFTDNPADNHKDENTNEDVDLKLGEVEEPYAQSQGPENFRFDQDHEFNIEKGADEEKQAIGLPDPEPNENMYGDYDRMDQAIPRPPDTEKSVYRALRAHYPADE